MNQDQDCNSVTPTYPFLSPLPFSGEGYDEILVTVRQVMNKSSEHRAHSYEQGNRFCTRCKQSCPSAGGMEIVLADKLHQRWICKRCKDHTEEKARSQSLSV